ncbi:hypothetical protein GCM10022247_47160 [Allokutzneria multivorans]|uniref:Uncharacterized protein n=1 Tax=Allokutzneria multivorans TaxID=1142134 RepID=A0ABP7SY67_9PSEU
MADQFGAVEEPAVAVDQPAQGRGQAAAVQVVDAHGLEYITNGLARERVAPSRERNGATAGGALRTGSVLGAALGADEPAVVPDDLAVALRTGTDVISGVHRSPLERISTGVPCRGDAVESCP